MALGITKAYSPVQGEVSNPTSYNTDVAALFNAFSGLEAQTSSLGGLTITPSANGTTKFLVNNVAGTELFSLDTTNSYAKLKATGKLYFDGGSDTYISESSADILDIYVGAANIIKITEAAADTVAINDAALTINTGKYLTLDGAVAASSVAYIVSPSTTQVVIGANGANILTVDGGTTDKVSIDAANLDIDTGKLINFDGGTGSDYIYSNTAGQILIGVGGSNNLIINSTTGGTGGTGTAGSGKQYVELNIKGTRYKLLHDGAI